MARWFCKSVPLAFLIFLVKDVMQKTQNPEPKTLKNDK
jgi:hypothetical protein